METSVNTFVDVVASSEGDAPASAAEGDAPASAAFAAAAASANSSAHGSSRPAARAATNAARAPTARSATSQSTSCVGALATDRRPCRVRVVSCSSASPKAPKARRLAAPTHATATIHSHVTRTDTRATRDVSFSRARRAASSAAMPSPRACTSRSVVTPKTPPSGPRPFAPSAATAANTAERSAAARKSCPAVRAGSVPSDATANAHIATYVHAPCRRACANARNRRVKRNGLPSGDRRSARSAARHRPASSRTSSPSRVRVRSSAVRVASPWARRSWKKVSSSSRLARFSALQRTTATHAEDTPSAYAQVHTSAMPWN